MHIFPPVFVTDYIVRDVVEMVPCGDKHSTCCQDLNVFKIYKLDLHTLYLNGITEV